MLIISCFRIYLWSLSGMDWCHGKEWRTHLSFLGGKPEGNTGPSVSILVSIAFAYFSVFSSFWNYAGQGFLWWGERPSLEPLVCAGHFEGCALSKVEAVINSLCRWDWVLSRVVCPRSHSYQAPGQVLEFLPVSRVLTCCAVVSETRRKSLIKISIAAASYQVPTMSQDQLISYRYF